MLKDRNESCLFTTILSDLYRWWRKTYDNLGVVLGLSILVVIYILLSFEIMHRTAVAILGAAIVMILNIILRYADFLELLEGVDLDTILLLMSMMMIVSVLARTRVFNYLASKILVTLYRSPFRLIVVLSSFTALVSAFIDNVTTVLLITPIAIEICRKIRVDPRPLLLSIVFASNIGGTATLIGDPPNIIIGSYAGLGFMEFIYNLTPIVVVDFVFFLLLIRLLFRRWFEYYRYQIAKIGNVSVESIAIDRHLFKRTMIALTIVISLFFLEDVLKYPPAVPAMIGAGILLVLTRKEVALEDVLADIDWPTLVFFMAMFVVIKGVEKLGLMHFIAYSIAGISQSLELIMMIIVWVSAIVSAFVDNIPFVMSMVPVIAIIASALGLDPKPLYWALSLGGCLGGNGTLIGASANVVVAGIAEKHGYHISFVSFLKYGMPVMITTVGIASIYLLLRYCLLGG